MGRPKRRRPKNDVDGSTCHTDTACTTRTDSANGIVEASEDSHDGDCVAARGTRVSSQNAKSKSRRKRARLKKKHLKKANRRKREKKERERLSRRSSNGGKRNWTADSVTFTVNHTLLDDGKPFHHSKVSPGPRDCYDEWLSESNSTPHDTRTITFSWLNEVGWYHRASEDNAVVVPLHQNGHVVALLKQLGGMKDRMWPAAVRCAAAHNAINFDQRTPYDEFAEARRACNQYEWLGEGQRGGLNNMFVNRSAIKLANMDALLNFSLISPPERADGPFIFVDLCGAPGGFSEYIMFRCSRGGLSCRGYGMSLLGENEDGNGIDWRIRHITAHGGENTSSFSVCGGADGTGDIYKRENIISLYDTIAGDADKVMPELGAPYNNDSMGNIVDRNKRSGLVHLVVADGGFDAQREVSSQEKLTQKIVIVQAGSALQLLQNGGHFVMKMFGHQTLEVRCLIEFLSHCFEKIILLKPVLSRPASAERYLVCMSFSGVEPSWDGGAWIDDIVQSTRVSGKPSKGTNAGKKGIDACPVSLGIYLDKFDADIARLNIKACSKILSYLESKAVSVETGGLDDGSEEGGGREEEANEAVAPYQTIVDMLAYKHAWQLNGPTKYD